MVYKDKAWLVGGLVGYKPDLMVYTSHLKKLIFVKKINKSTIEWQNSKSGSR